MAVYFQPADKYNFKNISALMLGNTIGQAIDSLIKGQIEHNVKAKEATAWKNFVGGLNAEDYMGLAPELATVKLIQQNGFGALTPNQQKNAFTMLQGFNKAWNRDKFFEALNDGASPSQQIVDNIQIASGETPVSKGQEFIGSGKIGINLPKMTYWATQAEIDPKNINNLQTAALDAPTPVSVDTGDKKHIIGVSSITGKATPLWQEANKVTPNMLAEIAHKEKENALDRKNNLDVASIRANNVGSANTGTGPLVKMNSEDFNAFMETADDEDMTEEQAKANANQLYTMLGNNEDSVKAAMLYMTKFRLAHSGGSTGKSGGKTEVIEQGSYASKRNKK